MFEYNVYYHSFNDNEIKPYNVLRDKGHIMEYINECRKKDMSKEEFVEGLRRECFYWYGSKCEWEIVIKQWVGKEVAEKIDVCMQLQMNWNVFSEICWKIYMGEIVDGNN